MQILLVIIAIAIWLGGVLAIFLSAGAPMTAFGPAISTIGIGTLCLAAARALTHMEDQAREAKRAADEIQSMHRTLALNAPMPKD
ncbi:MAG: hypothetical protein AAF739_00310 [Pseudomonadota bacterium]